MGKSGSDRRGRLRSTVSLSLTNPVRSPTPLISFCHMSPHFLYSSMQFVHFLQTLGIQADRSQHKMSISNVNS